MMMPPSEADDWRQSRGQPLSKDFLGLQWRTEFWVQRYVERRLIYFGDGSWHWWITEKMLSLDTGLRDAADYACLWYIGFNDIKILFTIKISIINDFSPKMKYSFQQYYALTLFHAWFILMTIVCLLFYTFPLPAASNTIHRAHIRRMPLVGCSARRHEECAGLLRRAAVNDWAIDRLSARHARRIRRLIDTRL